MQVSFTRNEVSAGLTLVNSIVAAFPKHIAKSAGAKIEKAAEAYQAIIKQEDELTALDMIGDFNKEFGDDDGLIKTFLTIDKELLVTYNPDACVEVLEAVNAEIPVLTGLAFTAYGLMLSFGTSFKRIGDKIKKSIKSRRK